MAIKKRKKRRSVKTRSAKQIAATKKLVALNKKRRANPKKRKTKRKVKAKVKVSAKSRVTGKRPTAKLKKRRAKNTKKGYYPNPDKTFYRVVGEMTRGKRGYFNGERLTMKATSAALFTDKKQAIKIAQSMADFLGRPVGVETIKK